MAEALELGKDFFIKPTVAPVVDYEPIGIGAMDLGQLTLEDGTTTPAV